MSNRTQQLCTFHVDNLYLGIAVQQVQEVIRHHAITPVPLAQRAVAGLINLRGQIVTAIDLRERIGLPPRAEGRLPMNVVVRSDDGAVSLLVDSIGDVIEVTEDNFESPPATLRGPARELVEGAYKLPTGLLLVLNTKEAVNTFGQDSKLVTV
jgi:purine-binding chemotaxis protein CheW